MTDEIIDLLDRYVAGQMDARERAAFEARMEADPAFRQVAEEHLKTVGALRKMKRHDELKQMFSAAHGDLPRVGPEPIVTTRPARVIGFWPAAAVAASIAIISVTGTLITTQSLKKEHNAEFRNLRKNVEQIQKSQQDLKADIAGIRQKEVPSAAYEGTGFFISANGYIVTSYHVVRDADSIFVENKKLGRLKARIVRFDPANDIAVLLVNDVPKLPSLPYMLSRKEAEIGEEVYTLGFPREDVVYGTGVISASTGYRQNEASYQVAVPVNPGNSGGPLLNERGDVIGMINGLETETLGAAFALKSNVLLDLIQEMPQDSLPKIVTLPAQNRLKSLSRVQQIKKLQDYLLVVRVYNQR